MGRNNQAPISAFMGIPSLNQCAPRESALPTSRNIGLARHADQCGSAYAPLPTY